MIENGCTKEKLVIGIPAYGRTYMLVDDNINVVGAAVEGEGTAGKITKSRGFLGFNEVSGAFFIFFLNTHFYFQMRLDL